MVSLDAGLIVAAIIVPILLLVSNLVMLAKYIDPQHAAGHYTAKFILVGGGCLLWWVPAVVAVGLGARRPRGPPCTPAVLRVCSSV